jgi:hypothetical protein
VLLVLVLVRLSGSPRWDVNPARPLSHLPPSLRHSQCGIHLYKWLPGPLPHEARPHAAAVVRLDHAALLSLPQRLPLLQHTLPLLVCLAPSRRFRLFQHLLCERLSGRWAARKVPKLQCTARTQARPGLAEIRLPTRSRGASSPTRRWMPCVLRGGRGWLGHGLLSHAPRFLITPHSGEDSPFVEGPSITIVTDFVVGMVAGIPW